MLFIKNIYSIYRFQRVLSIYQKNNTKFSNSSSIKLNLTLQKLFGSKQYKEAFEIVDQNFDICTDITINMAIKACAISKDYTRGINIHRKLSSHSINNSYIQASLIQLYSLISNNMPEKVLDLFDEITIEPDKYTVTVLFNACAKLANDRGMKIGKKLLEKMPRNFRNEDVLLISAMHMLIRFGDIQNAENLFPSIKNKSIITYATMMKAYVQNQMSEKALDLFEQIELNLNNAAYNIVFNACAELANDRAMKIGKKLLDEMPENLRNDNVVLTSALHMLMKFGDIQSAQKLFQSIQKNDIVTYGAIMKGYVRNQMPEKALDLFEQIELDLNNVVYTIVFAACAELANDRAMKIGKKLLNKIPKNFRNDNVVLTSAIHMLMKFGDIQNAEIIFQSIKNKNIITYGAMMKGYVENEMAEKALDLFEQMELNLNNVAYNILFNACAEVANDRAMKIGKKLLDEMPENLRNDNVVLNSVIHMLIRFGDIQNAENVFQSIKKKDIITYGTMMKGYIENQMSEKVLDLFEQIELNLNNFAYTFVFNACTELANDRAMKIGRKLLDEMPENLRNDNVVLNSVIHMLMKFGDIQNAENVFQSIREKDIITYGTMMNGYIENQMSEKVLDLFEQIELNLNNFAYTIVFNACAELANDRAMKIGKKLLDEMPENLRNDNVVLNSVIHMLMKFGDIQNAENVFQSIKKKDIIIYGTMMKGYIENQMSEKALDLFERIELNLNNFAYTFVFNACAELANDRAMKIGRKLLDGMPENLRNDNVVLTSAIHMLMKFGDIQNAENVFQSIKKKDTSTYGALMNGYNMNGLSRKCFKILEEMLKENIFPDEIIWNIVIGACSKIRLLRRCQYIINQIPLEIQNKKPIQISLIHMWGKCASIEKAQNVFQSIVDRDTMTYTAMINAFGLNGMGSEAIQLYRKMPNNLRNEISHICVLNACSHSGLLQEAWNIFNDIPLKTEKIYTTMVDCLSRLFLFDEAQNLINEYEKTNKPSLVMYISLLSGTRNNRNRNLSENIYNRMKCLFPNEKQDLMSGAILVSNIYSSVGEHELAKTFRYNQIKELGTNVKLGLTWTEEFTAHDHSHPKSSKIFSELERLTSEAIAHGYECDPSWVTRQLKEGETNLSVLCGHSERIAIAYNFVEEPDTKFIQVTNNLRVCGDCHQMTKIIAKIRQCHIIVGDANRIHHFNPNGQCSCQDHF
ncbi:unnamed protein product [Rotaria sordida]|uniref:DYW domain-containing protein n=1 Tax=Rotaria sordida TaxID=392033 RepID=A0A814Y2K3_9BILA|nr:unnamed protein product [Rotaria sordida]